jgi:hypothetical protein
LSHKYFQTVQNNVIKTFYGICRITDGRSYVGMILLVSISKMLSVYKDASCKWHNPYGMNINCVLMVYQRIGVYVCACCNTTCIVVMEHTHTHTCRTSDTHTQQQNYRSQCKVNISFSRTDKFESHLHNKK